MARRRCAHFVPGGNERMLAVALGLAADALVLDLEDSVAPEGKEQARETVAQWLRDVDFGAQERVVRVNPLATPWGRRDLEATLPSPPDAYLIPKVSDAAELHELDLLLNAGERDYGHPEGSLQLLVLATETPRGLLQIADLADCPRVAALTWGAEDLSAAIGSRRNRDETGEYLEVFRYARLMTLLAATAAGVQPLDTVYVDFRDLEGLRRECRAAAALGFTGKMSIHPSQVDVILEAFAPSAEELEESRALVDAFEAQRGSGRSAFRFRGQMVDVPHITRARHILESAEPPRRKPRGERGS